MGMTENEAIEFMKRYLDAECYTDKCVNAHNIAIKALKEVQQHRKMDATEEYKGLIEKAKIKKPIRDEYCGFTSYECPNCHHDISNEQKYCDKCGQRLKK